MSKALGKLFGNPRNPLPTNPATQKAERLNLIKFSRPHMRSFHFAWLGFLTAFTGWFAVAPLAPTIKKDLKLNPFQFNDSNIISVSSTIAFRILVGPLCDAIGPRKVMATLLLVGSIPVGLTGLANDREGLMIARFFVGILGATFVPCQFWTMQMFDSNVVGSANAIAGGWGNMGAGITYLLMPVIMQWFVDGGRSTHDAWRLTLVVPACLLIVVGIACLLFTDDCPEGKWKNRGKLVEEEKIVEVHDAGDVDKEKKATTIEPANKQSTATAPPTSKLRAFYIALSNPNVWVLMVMYSCTFGVELAVDNVLADFLFNHFHLTQKTAGLIGSLFGLMNLFSRATGGFLSDFASSRLGIRGRLLVQLLIMFFGGLFLFLFKFAVTTLTGAIIVLVIFSYFVQAGCGSSFGIVPFVNPAVSGAISGLVGAGGNIGGLIFTIIFKKYSEDTPTAFMVIGCVVMTVAFTAFTLKVDGMRLASFRKS
ncbi:2964_t:CDS:2 [Paraglomus brasilianum]|uniref:Nitrate/nitrite transporter n=1 Tax=Paraglomus brasilianum TaxID=144538 RepID=A0A9N8WCV5_9GLOM|nr:2964_t:CDS:2 [Paraglomus brasilianum]